MHGDEHVLEAVRAMAPLEGVSAAPLVALILGSGIALGLLAIVRLEQTEAAVLVAIGAGTIALRLIARRESGWGRTPEPRDLPRFGSPVASLGVTSRRLIATVGPSPNLPLLDEPLEAFQRAGIRPYRRLGLPVGYYLDLEFRRRTMTFLVRFAERRRASRFVDTLTSLTPNGAAVRPRA